jgi:putative endonuclease
MDCEHYYVYILSSHSGTLYIGVTNNIVRRIAEHKAKINKGFTSKYNCNRLMYYERFDDVGEAIDREKELKCWKRYEKEELIRTRNRMWFDLSARWHLPEVQPYEK